MYDHRWSSKRLKDGIAHHHNIVIKKPISSNLSVQAQQGSKVDHKVHEGSADASIDQTADALIFAGSAREVETPKKILAQVDTRQIELMVIGVLYEVSSSDKDGSALSLALNLLGGKFDIFLDGGFIREDQK